MKTTGLKPGQLWHTLQNNLTTDEESMYFSLADCPLIRWSLSTELFLSFILLLFILSFCPFKTNFVFFIQLSIISSFSELLVVFCFKIYLLIDLLDILLIIIDN